MFKITTRTSSGTIRLVVEGKLAKACASELDQCWQAAKLLAPEGPILMDLTGVTYIDACGKQLLAQMYEEGTAFLCGGLMTKFLIDEIKTEGSVTPCEKAARTNPLR